MVCKQIRAFKATNEIGLLLLVLWLTTSCGSMHQVSQQQLTREQYIAMYSGVAQQEMRLYHIPASITMAQACLESSNGNSYLARSARNHFGIKCTSDWHGRKVYKDDDNKNDCFRKYSNAKQSYRDHSLFLTTRERYSTLFKIKCNRGDDYYKEWAYGLQQCGYATNPNYGNILIKVIEDNQLYKLDKRRFLK